ncbi:MAG: 16S rRNA (uracil(1498)-N(3))-methyltransferase [Nitrospiraceae bacterium]|nr:16S rRNA (uracil(1498)-N(3))-methyltransferase [Nitrospiraceae bacterium]
MKIILSTDELKNKKVSISGEKARYLISVLRCRVGDEIQIFDGEGGLYNAKISALENKRVIADLPEKLSYSNESPLNLILVQGILKGEKMDWVIQKTTELGVKGIIPAITERSQLRYTRKLARWKKIAEEAAKQCGRTFIPVIHEYMEFNDIFKKQMNGLIFYEDGGISLSNALQNKNIRDEPFYVFIGPEGGFAKQEIKLAEDRGIITVSLGKRILKAETAAISALTLVQFIIGDMN